MKASGTRPVVASGGCLVLVVVVASWQSDWPRSALHGVRLAYLSHVSPLFWPSEAFSPERWKVAPTSERYRFAKSLLSSGVLVGRTPAEVGVLLDASQKSDARWVMRLRRCGYRNLWWVLVVEFREGRVAASRRDMAWLDP